MQYQLSCEQVGALMAFYIEDKLSDKLSKYVEEHLANCPICREKYETMKKIIHKYSNIQNQVKENETIETMSPFQTRQYEEFKANLSAYVDNELNDDENIKIKKITISNPLARQDLEDIYTFKKILHSSFEKTRNDVKEDYSRYILNQIENISDTNEIDPFFKIIAAFCIIMICIVAGIIGILYL
ncbi:MAG: zf-HC2 domain-containing protein [Candidatus Gastranaerophilaceae bacterium]